MDALQRDKMRRVQGVTVIEHAVCTDARGRVREREREAAEPPPRKPTTQEVSCDFEGGGLAR